MEFGNILYFVSCMALLVNVTAMCSYEPGKLE